MRNHTANTASTTVPAAAIASWSPGRVTLDDGTRGGEDVRRRQRLRDRLQRVGQGTHRVEDPRERQHQRDEAPREDLGALADAKDQADHDQPDGPPDEEQERHQRDQCEPEARDVEREEHERNHRDRPDTDGELHQPEQHDAGAVLELGHRRDHQVEQVP